MKKLYFLLLALCCISVQAQQIRGKLLDAQNKPVSFANILLMSSDSAFIAGTVSNDDGTFQVTANKQAALLKISYIGFQEQILDSKRSCCRSQPQQGFRRTAGIPFFSG